MNVDTKLRQMGITEFNDMQKAVSDRILHTESNLMVLSPTGSGKTLAYMLPLLELADSSSDSFQILVVVPGRELAQQSANVMKSLGSGFRGMACYGGRPTMDEHRVLRELRPQVIFATPGRINDHIDKGNISPSSVKVLVIDEFDKCMEMGFHEEMSSLIGKLSPSVRKILLSATRAEELDSQTIVDSSFDTVDFIDSDAPVSGRIGLYAVHTAGKDKLPELRDLLLSFGQESSIVFLNYRESVERVAGFLSELGFVVSAYHGGLDQRAREDALYKFANGSASILVSTNLGSRGLDIPEVDNIVNYHLPETDDEYIHRLGRTARWKESGRGFFLLSPGEQLPEPFSSKVTDYELPESSADVPVPKMGTIYIGKGKRDKISKGDVVGFLCKTGGIQGKDIGRIDVRDRYTYVAVCRKILDRVVSLANGQKIKGIKTVVEHVR